MKIILTSVMCFLMMISVAVAGPNYQIIDSKSEINESLQVGKFEWTIQAGDNSLNRFTIHRVVKLNKCLKPVKPYRLKGPIILLPGGYSNFDLYLSGKDGESLSTYLALKGMDVFGYSPRTRGLEAGFCDTNDCDPMQNWGMETYVDDIDYIRKLVTWFHFKRPVIGGLSMGAMIGIAAINEKPYGYAGALLHEGTLYYDSPVQELFYETCDSYKALWQEGIFYENEVGPYYKYIFFLYQNNPDDPSPFAEGLTNKEFFHLFLTSSYDPPMGEAPGYTYATGDMINGFKYVDHELLSGFINQINDYEPIGIIRDYICGLAGERGFTDQLHRFKKPILSIQAEYGFGSYSEDNLSLFGSTEISRIIHTDFGHMDSGTNTDYVNKVCEPVWGWLQEKIIPQWEWYKYFIDSFPEKNAFLE